MIEEKTLADVEHGNGGHVFFKTYELSHKKVLAIAAFITKITDSKNYT